MKVTVVGAGNVGASCAEYLAIKKIASNIVLLDIKEGLAEGKALDLSQTSTTLGFNSRIIGVTNNYVATSDSDVIVVTSGIPRKPGMTLSLIHISEPTRLRRIWVCGVWV